MTTSHTNRFEEAVRKFDAVHVEDPRRVTSEGKEYPEELLYSQRMAARLEEFAPDAPEAVRLAARAQHLRRREIPRSEYPEGRQGYRKWRTTLAKYHAETAGRILEEIGYEEVTIARVKDLVQKKVTSQ